MISGLPVARLGSVGRLQGSVPLVLGPKVSILKLPRLGRYSESRLPLLFCPDPPPFSIPSSVPSVSFRIFELLLERQRRAQTATSDNDNDAQTLLSPVLQHNFAPSDSMCTECDGTGVGGTGRIVLIRLEASGHLVTTEHAR
jgi:hypothetical protein